MRHLIIVALYFVCTAAVAQDYEPRINYGQPLEPTGRILHGAGQDPDAFLNYLNLMPEDTQPIVFMHYEGLFNIRPTWAAELKQQLVSLGDRMIVIQFGLELVGLTELIPSGALDDDIEVWLDGVEELGLPIYARLGYEFNGLAWNGYQPEPYKEAFKYLTEKIRARDLEIVTVWNYVPDPSQPTDFMAYYPGDEYVDWWSINIFEPSQITNIYTRDYLDSAIVHQRPILIGESTPKDVGVLDGQADWDAWFVPFFDLLKQEAGIKMTGYINWNWGDFPQWSTWGDARLGQNEVVLNLYKEAITDSVYFHAKPESQFRQLLGHSESDAPSQVINVTVDAESFPSVVSWDPTTDPSGISRYKLYNEGELVDFSKRTTLAFTNAEPGEEVQITVAAVDRAGNEGLSSEPVTFTMPLNDDEKDGDPEVGEDLIANGSFDQGLDGWSLTHFVPNVTGGLEIDSTGLMEGQNSAHVTILRNTGTNWHLQLEQPLSVKENHRYAISYQLRASRATPMEVWFQKSTQPFTGYAQRNVQLTTEVQSFQDTAFVPIDDEVFMRFMFGTSGLTEIWVDSVSVINLGIDPSSTPVEWYHENPTTVSLQTPFPNPAHKTSTIRYAIPHTASVKLEVFNLLGQKVATLIDKIQPGGNHELMWDVPTLPSGLYMIRLRHATNIQTKTFAIIR